MPVLAATNLELSFGDRKILGGVSLSVEAGERIGVVGRNGCGKSTLMKILAGLQKPDAGTVALSAGAAESGAGYLSQEPELDGSKTVREEAGSALAKVDALESRLHDVFEAMAGAGEDELERLLEEQARLEERLEQAGGLAQGHLVEAVLHGLGFEDARFGVKVDRLSGGQKARLALAKLLLTGPAVLLLDEPTNHLDIQGRLWLEGFLRDEYRGAVILISHDRALLDNVMQRIVEVEAIPGRANEGGRLIDYPGNYAAFRKQRAERRLSLRRAYDKQQTQFRKEEAFIRKYKAGQRAKQAKGRESRLERAKAEGGIERPLEIDSLRLALPKAERAGDIVAQCRGLGKWHERPASHGGGGRLTLFRDLDLTIERGERWGVIGPNGAGKSTLVRTILGEEEPSTGEARLGAKLSIGYFKQSHEGLDPEKTVVRYLQDVVRKECENVQLSEQAARDLAGAFLFSGRDQEKELGLLSGGERARAVFAGLMASAKNVLVLDEPTNHLDIPSAERLEEALRLPPTPREIALGERDADEKGFFDGTLILISHDRALLDACCNRLIVLDGAGGCEAFLGNYSEWAAKQAVTKAQTDEAAARATAKQRDAGTKRRSPDGGKAQKTNGKPVAPAARSTSGVNAVSKPAGSGGKSKWSWMRVEQLEEKIEYLSGQLAELDRELADPDIWADFERAERVQTKRDEIKGELEGLEAEWVRKAE